MFSPLFLVPPSPSTLIHLHHEGSNIGSGLGVQFLDNFEYMYDNSSESKTPGPFTWSFQALNTEYREDEKEEERKESRTGQIAHC